MERDSSAQIREWVSNPTSDSARNLIRLYEESEWRSTRLEVVRALGRFSDPRSLPFLIDLIRKNEDLAEQGLAILSLARQRTRGAKLFLKTTYLSASPALRPVFAHALGLAQEFEASERLLTDLKAARESQDSLWLKNLILALGELKEFRALPTIYEELLDSQHSGQDLLLACLFSLGRLERMPERLEALENRFLDDSVLWQVFDTTLSQVQIRSQFKLEDYLAKIFESEHPHPALPFELRAFPEKDLQVGLELFPFDRYWRRHLLCLRALTPGLRSAVLEELRRGLAQWGDEETLRDVFCEISRLGNTGFSLAEAEGFLKACPGAKSSSKDRLLWLEAFLPVIEMQAEAPVFLKSSDESESMQFLNLWSERSLGQAEASVKKDLRNFAAFDLSDGIFSRLLRASAELGVGEKTLDAAAEARWGALSCRSSVLVYSESFLPSWIQAKVLGLDPVVTDSAQNALLIQGLGVLKSSAEAGNLEAKTPGFVPWMQSLLQSLERSLSQANQQNQGGSSELVMAALRLIARVPDSRFESFVLSALASKDDSVRLNAVIASKGFSGVRALSEALVGFLEEPAITPIAGVLQGRAFDSVLAHTTLVAKRAAFGFFKSRMQDEFVIDKFYRDFDPEKKGGEEFYQAMIALLKDHPEHPQWEKLVALRDRLKPVGTLVASTGEDVSAHAAVTEIDDRLRSALVRFDHLHPAAKLALRAAEQPFLQAEGVSLPIDKAPIVLEFCKALDLLLERELGQKHLFPRLDRELHAFQTVWHRVGFGEEYPNSDRVLQALGLKGRISHELFPLHKAKLMSAAFFNGKILQDRFKVFDGLRAWAVIFLIFARKLPDASSKTGGTVGPLFKLKGFDDERCVQTAKKLMQLQDLRNPAAHRQTYSDLQALASVREETLGLINLILSE